MVHDSLTVSQLDNPLINKLDTYLRNIKKETLALHGFWSILTLQFLKVQPINQLNMFYMS